MNDRQLKPCVKCGHTDLYAKAGDAWFSCAVCMTMREGLATPWNRRAPAVSAERPGREGWVLVPIDPTGAMIDAPRRIILDDRMRANNGRTKAGVAIDIYRAMLSAVPATPEGQKEQGSSQGLGKDQCADAGPCPHSHVMVSRADIMKAWLGIGNNLADEEMWAAGERLFDAAALTPDGGEAVHSQPGDQAPSEPSSSTDKTNAG